MKEKTLDALDNLLDVLEEEDEEIKDKIIQAIDLIMEEEKKEEEEETK